LDAVAASSFVGGEHLGVGKRNSNYISYGLVAMITTTMVSSIYI
jgi:hypothetical protein